MSEQNETKPVVKLKKASESASKAAYKAGFVGLIGLPNSGKSSVMNLLVGEKVSIVSSKPQTTRRRSVGLVSEKDFQAVLLDAPGLIQAEKGLNNFLELEALEVIKESDVLMGVLNIDAKNFEELDKVIDLVVKSKKPHFFYINKCDLPQLHRPVRLREHLQKIGSPVIQGSAMTEVTKTKELIIEQIEKLLPEAPAPLYDVDLLSLQPSREIVGELIREQCFNQLHDEIPFGLAVKLLKYEEGVKLDKIYAELLVGKENHIKMVVGNKASRIKSIGEQSRREIEKFLKKKVFLDLHVKSQVNWQTNPRSLKELGYVHQQ